MLEVVEVAHVTDSKLTPSSESTCVYDWSGVLMDDRKLSDSFTAFWDMLADANRHSNDNCGNIEPDSKSEGFLQARRAASALDEELHIVIFELAEMWGPFRR